MKPDDDVQKVRSYLKNLYGSTIIDNAELVESTIEASSTHIRERLRERGITSANDEIIKSAPKEKRHVFRIQKRLNNLGVTISQSLIVITDPDGNVLDVIESG